MGSANYLTQFLKCEKGPKGALENLTLGRGGSPDGGSTRGRCPLVRTQALVEI